MKNISRLILVSLFILICVSSATAAPRMSIPEATFNFGYVPQNAKINHGFWLHSTGDDTLKILKVVPG